MKYKAGDWVVIREDLKAGERIQCGVVPQMEELAGKEMKVETVNYKSYFLEGGDGWSWTDEMIDHEKTWHLFGLGNDKDLVNYPPHYIRENLESINVIDAFFKDNYYLGQVWKYIARAGHKEDELKDLKKAQWYLNRYIKEKEGK